jgi:uncharacterized protein (TIGR02453 family)
MTRANAAYFTSGLFGFLKELKANNEREWFAENRARYTTLVEEPMLRFISDLGERLPQISPGFLADPRRAGGSMFRIYRDTRFSKDKTPYKTGTGAHFRHRSASKGQTVPGFYMHLEPGESVGGGGIYQPDPEALKRIRDRIVAEPAAWSRVIATKIVIEGDALKRPPRGYDPEHRFAEDLKRKDLYTLQRFTEKEVCSPRFMDTYLAACTRTAPLVEFLTRALGLRWK